MRAYLLILAGLPLMAQTETNIACVERLEIPTYPALAEQARITGTVIATVVLGFGSSVASISSASDHGKAHPLLIGGVEKSLRASKFANACAGKQVELIFNFVLEGTPVGSHPPQTISFAYPNQFWIATPPLLLNP
jgi:hypothetical protein